MESMKPNPTCPVCKGTGLAICSSLTVKRDASATRHVKHSPPIRLKIPLGKTGSDLMTGKFVAEFGREPTSGETYDGLVYSGHWFNRIKRSQKDEVIETREVMEICPLCLSNEYVYISSDATDLQEALEDGWARRNWMRTLKKALSFHKLTLVEAKPLIEAKMFDWMVEHTKKAGENTKWTAERLAEKYAPAPTVKKVKAVTTAKSKSSIASLKAALGL